MNAKDVALALLVVAVWGANFTVIKIGLAGVPPLVLAAARYVVVALPAVFFVRRPNVSIKHLLAYGVTVGVLQFAALFYAMHLGMPAGLSSVVMQSQAFFTAVFAYWFLQERITWRHAVGIVVAGIGLLLIANSQGAFGGGEDGSPVALIGILLTIGGAASWGLSNIIVRSAVRAASAREESVDMLGLVVWAALVPPLPLFVLALLVHGPGQIVGAFVEPTFPSIFAVLYLAFGATLFGYGGWSTLLGKYPASTVGPFSLLVPVTGLLTSGLVLSETLSPMQWVGSTLIVVGLLIVTVRVRLGVTARRAEDKAHG